jgi:hypothetical protein
MMDRRGLGTPATATAHSTEDAQSDKREHLARQDPWRTPAPREHHDKVVLSPLLVSTRRLQRLVDHFARRQ